MLRDYNDVVSTFCDLLSNKSTIAIFINYNDFAPIQALNSKLLLKYLNEFNVPAMTFIPNAYQTVFKNLYNNQ